MAKKNSNIETLNDSRLKPLQLQVADRYREKVLLEKAISLHKLWIRRLANVLATGFSATSSEYQPLFSQQKPRLNQIRLHFLK